MDAAVGRGTGASSVLSALSRRHQPHTPLVKGLPAASGAIADKLLGHPALAVRRPLQV